MNYTLNSTRDYHIHGMETLGWELTVSNALYPENSPCRTILKRNDSYGHFLHDYLSRFVPMEEIRNIIEIGGGYGYLMKDFLDKNASMKAAMLDISPYLLQKQKETLKDHDVAYMEKDFLETDAAELEVFDMAILNENLGDFPTLVGIGKNIFGLSIDEVEQPLKRVRQLFDQYSFEQPESESFNLNIGAIEAVEKLCSSGISYIFLGEHSCEATVPESYRRFIDVRSSGNPERISLKGHDEYTIKFSCLQKIAEAFNYHSIRGPFADFLEFDFAGKLRFIMASQSVEKDEHEIIRHFVEDLYKYEYLILVKQ